MRQQTLEIIRIFTWLPLHIKRRNDRRVEWIDRSNIVKVKFEYFHEVFQRLIHRFALARYFNVDHDSPSFSSKQLSNETICKSRNPSKGHNLLRWIGTELSKFSQMTHVESIALLMQVETVLRSIDVKINPRPAGRTQYKRQGVRIPCASADKFNSFNHLNSVILSKAHSFIERKQIVLFMDCGCDD